MNGMVKFSSSTIRDDVKDDDKAVSEEESLEVTDGKGLKNREG